MKEEKDKRVLLGMSGGTDSSVAAILLQDAGYEVTGVTFRFYEKEGDTAYLDDARELCSRLHIPHIAYDVREVFRKHIITYFIDEYLKGRTPVPCTLCNNRLKWPLLQRLADERDIPFIASGHYVQKRFIGECWHITQGADPDKDQSFFLWGLPQDIIARMILPLGNLAKTRVREIASERGFLKVASKRDSLGVCFCPGDYRNYLRKHTQADDIAPGPIFDEQRNYMGMHEGYPFYTIGQRRGLGVYRNKALFVKEILPEENAVILADNLRSLEHRAFYLTHWHLPNPEAVFASREPLIVKIRYRKQANRCSVSLTPDNRLRVHLHEPLASIACGQAAVFYRDDVVLGGGIIDGVGE